MKLIVGLGNPGESYTYTRHNYGKLVVEAFANKYTLPFKSERKFHGQIASGEVAKESCLLLLPATFMNLSGRAVAAVCRFYKIQAEEVLVVYDDVDLPFGEVKLKKDGGAGGHNGLKDIALALSSNKFGRLRLGIRPMRAYHDLSDFVLQRFSEEEKAHLPGLFDRAFDSIESTLGRTMEEALAFCNDKKQKNEAQLKKREQQQAPGKPVTGDS